MLRNRSKVRGLTMLEVMVACGLLGTVFLATAYIESTTAKQIRALYGDARTLHRAHLVMERIRYKLVMGRVGSPVITDGGTGLRYVDPNNNGAVSGFRCINGDVFWYQNIAVNDPSAPGQGIGPVRTISFAVLGPGNAVSVTVQTEERYQWRLLPRPYTLKADITLRN
jgi:hypothetical protein